MEQNKKNPQSKLVYCKDSPYIDIQWQKGQIFVSNAVLRLIGTPSGVRLLWNNAKRELIIEPTDISDPDGFPVIGQTYAQHGSLFIGSVTFINEIWTTTDWDKSMRYRIIAKYNEPFNLAIFELKNAVAFEIVKIMHKVR